MGRFPGFLRNIMHEFDLIKTYFAPLAASFPGSLNLTDDAALVDVPAGQQLVITKDAICEGVHFIGNESPALIARKLLRVNLSDLAAKGAAPLCYVLALMLPKNTSEEWIRDLARGLAEDQKTFGIHLAGGDTTATRGALNLSLTALGTIPQGGMLKRSGAKVGDRIYVSGTLGDSALGLFALQNNSHTPHGYLVERYQLPEPRLALGQALRGIVNASMDISDGLVQDLRHICKTSSVGAIIHSQKIPLSGAARNQPNALEAALSGGDDYELLFTASAEKTSAISTLAQELQLPLTCIGSITNEESVRILDAKGNPIALARGGFEHQF
jgi:thiamine-monophosphate kinase